ncbi:hypothetical protein MERGE_001493 [Pneumocystis wakefieldiae]|uniref:Mini-chromosome maintenance complex-binding protein n=1 Tax=Pneumocystis wakefieldiae TaxID=38082 RepID=A0A899G3E9_9ASCO|nr:hypothetical protein MERGE_001493 [Pneumocystis wakefieldiae]
MVRSAVDSWLNNPLSEICAIFEEKYSKKQTLDIFSDFDVQRCFLSVFCSNSQREKIPSLESTPTESLDTGKLVRMTCMIQDTSFGQEICMGAYKIEGQGWKLSRYDLSTPERSALDPSDPSILLDERQCLYATSIPGESEWLQGDLASMLGSLSLDTSSETCITERFALKGQKHLAVILKTYAGMEASFRVCSLVEVIGILEKDTETVQEFMTNEQYTTKLHLPIIHVIHMNMVDLNELVIRCLGAMKQDDISKTRKDIINHLKTIFCNDILVAEFLLLNLVSSVSSRLPAIILGAFPINIRNCTPTISLRFKDFLKNVIPAFVYEKIDINNLNNNKFYPSSDGEKFQAGIMQLAKGTIVCFDETSMDEGTLNDTGVKNIRSLSQVVMSQVLPFHFSFSEFEIETDLTIIILSKNEKTLLPVDTSISIRPRPLSDSALLLSPTSDELLQFRKYFAHTRQISVGISNEISEKIQLDFVQQRQFGNKIGEKELGFRISIAKLIAKTYGSKSVSWDHWIDAIGCMLFH